MSIPGCPTCGGGLPGYVPDENVCRCGSEWGEPVGQFGTLARAKMGREEWAVTGHLLAVRSGNRCEIRTPGVCLAPGRNGELAGLPRHLISFHHRRPRGKGGTRRRDAHTLAVLVLACGHGTTGCHGWVEDDREEAEARGLLVPHGIIDPADVVLVLQGGRRVLLDPVHPFYLDPGDGRPFDLTGQLPRAG